MLILTNEAFKRAVEQCISSLVLRLPGDEKSCMRESGNEATIGPFRLMATPVAQY